jgi:hypothetical protein
MSTSESRQTENGKDQMQNNYRRLEGIISAAGWGAFLILVGVLFFTDNKGWLNGNGWLYFAIGLGSIFVVCFLVRYLLGHNNLWQIFDGLAVGLSLIFIGVAFLNDFGDWWPVALVLVGAGYLVKAVLGNKPKSFPI